MADLMRVLMAAQSHASPHRYTTDDATTHSKSGLERTEPAAPSDIVGSGVPGRLVGDLSPTPGAPSISPHLPLKEKMLPTAVADDDAQRTHLIFVALWLSWVSVVWGITAGSVSVAVGLLDSSLGVLGLGLNVLADVTGSAVLVWRFRAELRHSGHADQAEARAALIVGVALCTVSVVLAVSAIHALAVESHPGHSTVGLLVAGLAIVVLSPLAYGKRRVAAQLDSRALRGDGTLSAIGAGIAVLALTGLLLDEAFGWWWADRVAALVVAVIAATEAVKVLQE